MSESVYGELRAMIGEEQEPVVAVDEVCGQMIRHWCEAMEDANPMYTDEEYARNGRYGGIIAPPQMIWAWSLPPLWPAEAQSRGQRKLLETCARGGYDQVIDTDVELEFLAPLRPGDRMTATAKVTGVSEEKRTGLGKGHFIVVEMAYRNQREELVCIQRMTLLIYKARGEDDPQ